MTLLETRQAGDRKRESWLILLAAESAEKNWSLREARHRAAADVADACGYGNIQSPKSVANIITEGALAAHPSVRDYLTRLVALRDEVWELEPAYLRLTLHGPSQTLIDMMRRQKQPQERHHVADALAYLAYLRTHRFPNRQKTEDSAG